MSAINALTLLGAFVLLQTCCEGDCGHGEMHVPVTRTPIVSARWTVEINSDGTRRLVAHWFVNQHELTSKDTSATAAIPPTGARPRPSDLRRDAHFAPAV